ncbi:10012_t:CDS:2, partial [Paraglomus occultum]
GTVDLTMRTIKADGKLTEATERTGEFCGGSYVDQEFLKYVGKKVGASAVEMLKENHYGQLQYLIQGFCSQIKYDFNDNPKDYKCQEMDLEELCPAIKQYVKGSERLQIEEDEWIIELDYETVKSFFDPVVTKICALIRKQLSATRKKCSAMFVVGGFSTSQYLFKKIKKEFDSRVSAIASPPHPIAAVMYGAVFYGINKSVVETRVLKRTYGLELTETWSFKHPIERKRDSGGVYYFHTMAQRGTEVPVDKSFLQDVVPFKPSQTSLRLSVYTTSQDDVTYCDDPGTELLGTLVIDLPDPYTEREVEFTLTFGAHETKVKARNKVNGRIYTASYKLVL